MGEESKKFKYGDQEIDVNKLTKYLHDNADGWLTSENYGKDQEAVRTSINDMIGRIQSGDISSLDYAGNIQSQGGFVNNSRDKKFLGIRTGETLNTNGEAAYYLDKALQAYNTSTKTVKSSKPKFSTDLLHKSFLKNTTAGNELTNDNIESLWYNLDNKLEDGTRGITNRLASYGNFLDNYANSADLDTYDYTGSSFSDANAYREALRKAATYAKEGDYDNFVRAYAATGGDDYNTLFSKGAVDTTEKTQAETERAATIKELKNAGYTDEQINKYMASVDAWEKQQRDTNFLNATTDMDWQMHAQDQFTSNANGTWSLNNYNKGKGRGAAFWLGNKGKAAGLNGQKGEYDQTGYFTTHANQIRNIESKISRGEALTNNDMGGGIKEAELAAAYIFYDIQAHPNDYIKSGDGSYIIKASIKQDGTAYRYNPTNRVLYLYHNNGKDTPTLNNYYKSAWLNNRNKTASGKYAKGGNIPIAFGGKSVESLINDKKAQDLANLKKEASKKDMSVDQYRNSNRHIFDNGKGETTLSKADKARMVSIGADIAGLLASFTGVGTVANAGTGLVSLGSNLYADIEDGMDAGDVAKNLAVNSGLALAGFIPGGNSFKIARNLVRIAPKVLAVCAASGVLLDKNVMQSWEKAINSGSENRLTVQDWKNISSTLTAVHSLTAMGTSHYKSRKFAKEVGREQISRNANEAASKANTLDSTTPESAPSWGTKISNSISNTQRNISNGFKDFVAPKYKFNGDKLFQMQESIDRSKSIFTGRYSDKGLWLAAQRYNQPLADIAYKRSYLKKYGNTRRQWRQSSEEPDRYDDPEIPTATPAASVTAIPSEANGGKLIYKAQDASSQPADWYANRFAQKSLTGWNIDLDSSKAGENINNNPLHHKYGDLTGAYTSNNDYTSRPNIVGLDLNNYYKNSYDGKSLDDFIKGYNTDAATINSRWARNDISYNSTDAEKHNQLYSKMFGSRSGSTSNLYDLGYSPSTANIQGSTTWMRRMDQYKDAFENLSDAEKKNRIYKIGNEGFVYKKENGDIAKVDDDTLMHLGYIKNNIAAGLSDGNDRNRKPESHIASNVLKTLKGIDPNIAQIPLGMAHNKKMRDLALGKKISLDKYTDANSNIVGDFTGYQNSLAGANNLESIGNRLASNTSNSADAANYMLAAASKAQVSRNEGNNIFDNGVKQYSQQSLAQNKINSNAHDAIANENSMRVTQKFNADQDAIMATDNYETIFKPAIMEASLNYKQKKQNDLQSELLGLNQAKQRAYESFVTPWHNKLAAAKASEYDGLFSEYQNKFKQYNDTVLRDFDDKILKLRGVDMSKYKGTNNYVFHRNGGILKSLKSGGKVNDDGPVKTQSKDLDRFYKAVEAASKSHDKKLARLAASYMLSLKRTMG